MNWNRWNLGGLSILLFVVGLVLLIAGCWLVAATSILLAGATAFLGYRFSGGAENPALYADLDLFGFVAYAVRSANARIGFHSMRDQGEVVAALRAAGFALTSNDMRSEMRQLLTRDKRAFDACRHLMVIQTVHGGKQHFWNGFGQAQSAQWFLRAEIIIDLSSSSDALKSRLFELVGKENGQTPEQPAGG